MVQKKKSRIQSENHDQTTLSQLLVHDIIERRQNQEVEKLNISPPPPQKKKK